MRPGCRELRDAWIEHAQPRALEGELAAHLATCEECARFVANARRIARAMAELPRLEAPDELPGRVVAACHAGFLQERAARLARELARLEVPSALEQKVLGTASRELRAPAVLDRLVAEDLRDPAKAIARRYAGSLKRHEAPKTLAGRVSSELRRPRAALRGLRAWHLIAACSAGLALVLGIEMWRAPDTRAAEPIAVQIEHVGRASDLGPLAASLFDSLAGPAGFVEDPADGEVGGASDGLGVPR